MFVSVSMLFGMWHIKKGDTICTLASEARGVSFRVSEMSLLLQNCWGRFSSKDIGVPESNRFEVSTMEKSMVPNNKPSPLE